MKVSVGSYTFDNVSYDADVDVLYLHVGDPSTAVDFDESPDNRVGEKQPAEAFHHGSASEALQGALRAVRNGYREMIESWRR